MPGAGSTVIREVATKMKAFAGAIAVVVGLTAIAACGGSGGQSMACSRYIACVVKFVGSSASLDSTYGPSGTCWMDPQTSESCNTRCKMALAAFPGDAGC